VHPARDGSSRGIDDEVHVIRHQAVAEDSPVEAVRSVSEVLEEALVVPRVAEDRLAPISTAGYVYESIR
jgi:hypothetical protein